MKTMRHTTSTFLILAGTCSSVLAFQGVLPRAHVKPVLSRPSTTTALAVERKTDDNFETLVPETSFGAETVPKEQRPVNEYLDVTSQPFFGWANPENGSKGLLTRLVILYSVVFAVVCYPISGATYTQEGYLLQKLAASNIGSMLLVLVLLLRIYSGWSYVGSRLNSKVIEFEETGWYDGDIEYKAETELKRDRFLFNSEVKPVVERLKVFLYGAIGLSVASFIALNVATSAKPIFDEYNPDMLSRLRYDETLAGKVAENSASRPTYCDSRYYRAVAGGGQGCND
jgi:hypothetical protein